MDIFRNIKVLEVDEDYFIGARGYKLYKYFFTSKKYEFIGKLNDSKYALASFFYLSRRLLRAEITNLYTLENGDRLAIAKKGIFLCKKGHVVFNKCFSISRGSRPLNLLISPDNQIYFGEYFANMGKKAVHIYHSKDFGKSWDIVYTFNEGNINHIHGLFWDTFTKKIWVVTGDRENECIIANTADDFRTLDVVFRGGQEYRATNLFFYKDFIVYGTDSQYKVNELRKIDRQSLKIETLSQIQGTAIKGGQVDNISFISTTVEPSKVNKDKYSHLWVSHDGVQWKDVFKAPKDIYPMIFQFGSIEFPHYRCHIKDNFMFSGRALKKLGGNSAKISI